MAISAPSGGEAGSGNDRLFGGAGNDQLFGEGGDDLVDPGTGTSDTFDAADLPGVSSYTAPAATPDPLPVAEDRFAETVSPPLPAVGPAAGRFVALAGPAAGDVPTGLDRATGVALAVSDSARFVAFSTIIGGAEEIHVAVQDAAGWRELAGSATLGGGVRQPRPVACPGDRNRRVRRSGGGLDRDDRCRKKRSG